MLLTWNLACEEVIPKDLLTLLQCLSDEAYAFFHKVSNDYYMTCLYSDDVIGCEVGGAAKNAIAVVSGISTPGMGENTDTALILEEF